MLAFSKAPYERGNGLCVKDVACELKQLCADLQSELFTLCAHALRTPYVEAKVLLGRHISEAVTTIDRIRARLRYLRCPLPDLVVPEPVKHCTANLSAAPLVELSNHYKEGREALGQAVGRLLHSVNSVWDEPTFKILQDIVALLDCQRGEAHTVLSGIDSSIGLGTVAASQCGTPMRDSRFRIVETMTRPSNDAPADLKIMFVLHFLLMSTEIPTIETCAAMMLDFPTMPWDFFTDIGQQSWDESRHAAAFYNRIIERDGTIGQFPVEVSLWKMTHERPLPLRLAIHQRIGEWIGVDAAVAWARRLRDMGDDRTAEIFEFVCADEINHVSLGNKWLRQCVESDDAVASIHKQAEEIRFAFYKGADLKLHPVNPELCRLAGFTETEIAMLSNRHPG